MRTEDFDYHLPEELIAQTPVPRGDSRMLVLGRRTGAIDLRAFRDLPSFLRPGDTLVVNDSRVIARRLMAERESGRPVELLLLRPRGDAAWEALARPARSLRPGATVRLTLRGGETAIATVTGATEEGGRILELADAATRDRLATEGAAPLPPYIRGRLEDEERYQTVYSGLAGSAAAPTAGLHFSQEMLDGIEAAGIGIARVTLHVGVDTFRPVKVEDVASHVMHGEWFSIGAADAQRINATAGRIVAVGTTSVRALESAAVGPRSVRACTADTRLFITPGYQFKMVDALLTNFHLPKSTLLMLVSALAGREAVLAAYEAAVREKFRFYSFGDAMLIV